VEQSVSHCSDVRFHVIDSDFWVSSFPRGFVLLCFVCMRACVSEWMCSLFSHRYARTPQKVCACVGESAVVVFSLRLSSLVLSSPCTWTSPRFGPSASSKSSFLSPRIECVFASPPSGLAVGACVCMCVYVCVFASPPSGLAVRATKASHLPFVSASGLWCHDVCARAPVKGWQSVKGWLSV